MNHTPGPWKTNIWDYPDATPPRRELIVQSSGALLARIAWDEGRENPYTVADAEARANARLMAHAPALLEALEMLKFWVWKYHRAEALDSQTWQRAGEAIRAATMETADEWIAAHPEIAAANAASKAEGRADG